MQWRDLFMDYYIKPEKRWDVDLVMKSHIYVGPSRGPYLLRGEVVMVHAQHTLMLRRSHAHLPGRWRSWPRKSFLHYVRLHVAQKRVDQHFTGSAGHGPPDPVRSVRVPEQKVPRPAVSSQRNGFRGALFVCLLWNPNRLT